MYKIARSEAWNRDAWIKNWRWIHASEQMDYIGIHLVRDV
jgi:hypothetical protein